MNAIHDRDDALANWSRALACAPHVVVRATVDEPDRIQRLADHSASLFGLLNYVYENYDVSGNELAELEWDIDLLSGASSFLYRNLGLSSEATVTRIQRLSGAMMGTAQYMDRDPLEAWQQVRAAATTLPVAAGEQS
jgi:hypothetical protein